jgi:hypothetical protein
MPMSDEKPPYMPYFTPHRKGDPGTEDHIDCDYCTATELEPLINDLDLRPIGVYIGELIGQVMVKLNGKGNTILICRLIKERIERDFKVI